VVVRMMDESPGDANPVAILEHLLTLEPGYRNAHFLKASRDFYEADWDYELVERIETEFAKDFRAVAAKIEAAWGKPDYLGHRDDSEFPEFYTVEELCYWRKGEVLALVWWEHQEKEVPVLLALGVFRPEDLL
jgi:hypothetical protein